MNLAAPHVVCIALAFWFGACTGAGTPPPTPKTDAAPATTAPPIDAATATPTGTPMQLRLNSTPVGAIAFVNGKQIGATPISHTIYVTDAPVEFAFKLAGYQPATYTFVPQVAGEVHGRLVPVAIEPPTATPSP